MFDRFSETAPEDFLPREEDSHEYEPEEATVLAPDELEPECTCEGSGDIWDASGCELHNPESPYRRRQRELERGHWYEVKLESAEDPLEDWAA